MSPQSEPPVSLLEHSDARWIWPDGVSAGPNQYIDFRQTFDLDAADARAELLISADSNYAVWINGGFVACGQYSDYPDQKTCDRLPIADHLCTGRNELMIRVHYQGVDSFQYIAGPPGLIFELRSGDHRQLSGSATEWRGTAGYREGEMPRTTFQLGFTFEFNAGRAPDAWGTIGTEGIRGSASARGSQPRPVQRTAILPRIPVTLAAQGIVRRPVREDDSSAIVSHLVHGDFLSARHPRGFLRDASLRTLPSEAGVGLKGDAVEGDGIYFVIDLGRQEAGLLDLEVDAAAGTVIDIAHGEHLDDLRVRAVVGRYNFANRYVCGAGRQRFTHHFHRIAGRYLQLHVLGDCEAFRLHYAGLLPMVYPVEVRGSFDCGDSLHRRIWQTGLRTLHLCMHEHYEDTPWREQALYAFDGRNQALCGYHCFGEYPFAAASWELLGRSLQPDGWLEMCAPARIDITIPSFSFAWVLALADYHLYSGDSGLLHRMGPVVHTFMQTHLKRMVGDLLPCPPGERYWQFYEWMPGLDGLVRVKASDPPRFEAPLNLFFCFALRAAARISRACGDSSAAEHYDAVADRLRLAVGEQFWNAQAGGYQTTLNAAPHLAELTQALALLAEVPSAPRASELRARLARPDNELIAATLSHCLYKFEALLMDRQQYGRQVFDTIAHDWGRMLDRGATSFWETLRGADDFEKAGSLCHGWSAVPVYFQSAYLLGVRPLEPGFASFSVDPLLGVVESAAGRIPTPRGPIDIRWKDTGDGVKIQNLTHPHGLVAKPSSGVRLT